MTVVGVQCLRGVLYNSFRITSEDFKICNSVYRKILDNNVIVKAF